MRLADILGLDSVKPVSRWKASRLARKAALFRSMSHSALSALIDQSSQTIYGPGAIIVRQGERDDTVFMVLAGRVRVMRSESQMEVLVAELGPGEVFGELGVLEGKPRSANIIAAEQTNCLVVPGTAFMAALK